MVNLIINNSRWFVVSIILAITGLVLLLAAVPLAEADGKNNNQANINWAGIALVKQASNNIISANRCYDDQLQRTQAFGIKEYDAYASNIFTNNNCKGNLLAGLAASGRADVIANNIE